MDVNISLLIVFVWNIQVVLLFVNTALYQGTGMLLREALAARYRAKIHATRHSLYYAN